MSSPDKHVPKHRAPGAHKLKREPRRLLRRAVVMTGVAAAATGVAVSTGVMSGPDEAASAGSTTQVFTSDGLAESVLADRKTETTVSRSDRRKRQDPVKMAALSTSTGKVTRGSQRLDDSDPREIARALLPEFGFSVSQFSCLDMLYVSESNWRIDADNPSSSAYGIPQALTQTHDMPEGYMTSAEVQIRWGLDYIADRYGTPCSAWSFKAANNWY